MPSRNLSDAHELIQKQFPIAKAAFEKANKGVEVFLTCSYRSPAEQTALYNQPHDGKDNDGDKRIDEADEKVTNAKALQSPHNYLPSFAIDVAFKVNGIVDWSDKWFTAFSKYMKKAQIDWAVIGHHSKTRLITKSKVGNHKYTNELTILQIPSI